MKTGRKRFYKITWIPGLLIVSALSGKTKTQQLLLQHG